MAYCRKCGNKLKDGAKFCPKCGTPVVATQSNSNSSDNSSYYCIELISVRAGTLQVTKALIDLLGVETREAKDIINCTPCILVTGITLSRAKEIAQILQNAGAEIAIKQNEKPIQSKQPIQNNPSFQIKEQSKNRQTTYKAPVEHIKNSEDDGSYATRVPQRNTNNNIGAIPKIIILTAVGLLIMWFLGVFDDSSSSSFSKAEKSQVVEKTQEVEKPKVNLSLVGTYEATTFGNKSQLHIILKENGTAESYYPPTKQEYTYYARWREVDGGIQICYNDANKQPSVRYPWGHEYDHRFDFTRRCCYISDGYLYPDIITFDKREDGWRIPIVKIN